MMKNLPDKISIGDKYSPAMEIKTEKEAKAYFNVLVEHTMRVGSVDRAEAERIEKANLGYYAGYYSELTRERVEHLFKCAHPIFGSIAENGAPSPEKAFKMGEELGKKLRNK